MDTQAGIMSNSSGLNGTIHNFETFYLSAFNDNFTGNDTAETVQTYAGDDVLNGGGGNDKLYGGDGADIFYTSAGADILYGQNGVDRFVVNESATNDNDMNFVSGYESGEVIDISALLSGYNATTDAITELVNIAQGANTTIQIDRDGAGNTYGWDNVLRLVGHTAISTDENALVTSGTLVV